MFSGYEILSWFFVYFVIGANLYVLDKKYGVVLYNKWKKYSSNNMEEYKDDYTKGFIYNRRTRVKILWASNISFVFSLSVFLGGYSLLPVEIVMFFLEIPVTFLGILVGPFYAKLLRMSERTVEKLDEFEGDDGSLENAAKKVIDKTSQEIKEGFSKTAQDIKESVGDVVDKVNDEIKDVTSSNQSEVKKEDKSYENANNTINDILGKK